MARISIDCAVCSSTLSVAALPGAVVVVLAIVASQFTSAEALGADLSKADPAWVTVAVVLHGAFFVLYGGLYAAGFRAVGVSSGALRLVPVMFASIFAKTAVPFTAAPAAAVRPADAERAGWNGSSSAPPEAPEPAADDLIGDEWQAAGASDTLAFEPTELEQILGFPLS